MTRAFRVAAVAAALASPVVPRTARAQDTTFRGITIGGTYDPRRDKPGIAILPIGGAFGDSVRAIVQRDLDYSDRFTIVPIDQADTSALKLAGAAGLNYPLFARLAAAAVVQITALPSGLHVALHDVARASVINVDELRLNGSSLGRDWRLSVHRVSDEVERWITGRSGIAATRIAYIRGKSIRIVDSDGANEITVPTDENGYRAAWNANGTMLVYNTYGVDAGDVGSRLLLVDLATARSRTLVPASRSGVFISPVFAPNGESVIFSRARDEGTDLFSVGIQGSEPPLRLTNGRGTNNTNPTMSPDGRRIAFMSDRLGRPELYIMDADGTNQDVLTNYDFSEKNYRSDPDWAPDNSLIAYQERINGRFQIRTIPVRGGTPKLLTSEGENQHPSWAPDSRHVVFASDRTGVGQLWVLDVQSGRVRQLTKSAGSKLAAWSPRLTGG